jgi:hypothetical protein
VGLAEGSAEGRYVSPYTRATIAAARGEIDDALALLNTAVDHGVAALPYIAIDPRMDPLRTDSRFADLVQRVGLGSAKAT